MLQSRHRVAAVLAVPALVLALSSCSSSAQVPEGYREVTKGNLRVAVPEGWVDGTPSGSYDLALQDVAGDAFTVRLLASSSSDAGTARNAISDIRDFAGIVPDEPTDASEVEREDGREMWSWDITYDDGQYALAAWALRDDDLDATVVVTLSSKGALDKELAEDVRDSIDIVAAD